MEWRKGNQRPGRSGKALQRRELPQENSLPGGLYRQREEQACAQARKCQSRVCAGNTNSGFLGGWGGSVRWSGDQAGCEGKSQHMSLGWQSKGFRFYLVGTGEFWGVQKSSNSRSVTTLSGGWIGRNQYQKQGDQWGAISVFLWDTGRGKRELVLCVISGG